MAGAGLGGALRFAVALWVMARYEGKFPLATFLANVMGCFLIGLLMTIFTERIEPHPYWRLFLVVGVLGGFTTFSSFAYETLSAVRLGGRMLALGYTLSSVVAGYLAVWLGEALAMKR